MTRSPDATRKRSRLRPDDRREHLIRTAVTLFADQGVAATSILRITQAAGLSNGIFYHYFANKDALQNAVASLVLNDLIDKLATVQDSESYPDRIAMGAVGTMRAVAANRQLGAVLVQYIEGHHDFLHRIPLRLDDDVAAGVQAGDFGTDTPRPLLVGFLVATLVAGARAVLAGADPDETGEHLAAAHLRLLGVPNQRSRAIAARAKRMRRVV